MLTLISSIAGYIVALFPRLFDRWQDAADKKHELEIMHMQLQQQLRMVDKGVGIPNKEAELRTEVATQQEYGEQMAMIYNQQEKLLEGASKWVRDLTAATRPLVTFLFVLELVAINFIILAWTFWNGDRITSVGEFLQIMNIVFDADEMALLGTIIAMWFGSRGNSKAAK